ncbi:DsbC family protein [Thermodesulfatator atlanticus]|uniref:DsbC family protein n=1 Tax=Thermodesulfatator atlanticus TaxID=501497 RepID=UPI0003B5D2F9|nr:DsbC family protein [Thermodesulfatator atlanticus]
MKRSIVLSCLVLLLFAGVSFATCPSAKETEKTLSPLFGGQKINVLSVKPSPIKGLCEVVIKTAGGKRPLYIDEKGKYLVLGRIIDIAARLDLTQERITDLNRLSKEKLAELKKLVAFSEGKGPEIFFITDPDCPHCKRAEGILHEMIKKGKIRVNVIFMPLERLHPKAKEKAVAIICDKKGLKELREGYTGTQCEEGKKKVEKTLKTLPGLGIRATPTYIFPDGKVISGVLKEEQILKLVK